MRQSTIARLLGRQLLTGFPSAQIVWPNDIAGLPDKPFIAFQIVRVGTESRTLARGQEVRIGFAMITIVQAVDVFATAAEDMADQVGALFPFGLRLVDAQGTITITRPPEVMTAFRDGPDYRVPVRVAFEANSTV